MDLDPVEGGSRVLSDEEVVAVARIGLATEAHYGSPQDTEWAMAGGRTYLVQSRPGDGGRRGRGPAAAGQGTLLVQGLAASAGRASGVVRVLQSPDQGDRLQSGEVLVAPMTSPDWVPTMRRAAAMRDRWRGHDLPRRHRLAASWASLPWSVPAPPRPCCATASS